MSLRPYSGLPRGELYGPAQAIACLSEDPPLAPPAYHEVRNGLITRWIDTPG